MARDRQTDKRGDVQQMKEGDYAQCTEEAGTKPRVRILPADTVIRRLKIPSQRNTKPLDEKKTKKNKTCTPSLANTAVILDT